MYNKLITLVMVCCFCNTLIAQDSLRSNENRLMELIESNMEENSGSLDFNTLLEQLEYYTKHPLDINTASEEEFINTGLFTNYQVRTIINHRTTYGGFIEVGELRSLHVFTERELKLILPYLTTKRYQEEKGLWKQIKGGTHLVLTRAQRVIDTQAGYSAKQGTSKSYEGDPWKLYTRYRYHKGYQFSAGFTLEKDAGETLFRGSNTITNGKIYQGFDYSSAHLLYRSDGLVKTVALGDYELRFGQGLVLWNGLSFRKSAYVMNVMKSGPELKQYTSANEYNYLRGGATKLAKGKVSLITFYSSKKLDANITKIDSLIGDVLEVSSFQQTGLHRKSSEIMDKAVVNQTMIGSRASFNSRHIRVSLTGTHTSLSNHFQKKFRIDNQFEFSGKRLTNIGLDYKMDTGNLQLFGETAYSSNGGTAIINGLEYHPHSNMGIYAAHRMYSKKYTAFYANAFGERTTQNNESGVYLATALKLGKNWELWAYYDQYKHNWLKYNVDAPSRGSDYLIQANYSPTSNTHMYFRYKNEVKQENNSEHSGTTNVLSDVRKARFRYHLTHELNHYFSLKSRFEYALFEVGNVRKTGYLMYQDVQYRIPHTPLRLTGRIAYFDTESFDAAIYAYENDVLYSFSVPAYYNKGARTYLMLRIKASKQMIFWVRYARTYFTNTNSIGSDGEEIQGNTKSDIKFQFAWTF